MTATLLHVLYRVAITAEAMSAALSAGRRQMDWVGVCLLASITALGGGSIRDMLLGHYPLSWVANPRFLLVTEGAALFAVGCRCAGKDIRSVRLSCLDRLSFRIHFKSRASHRVEHRVLGEYLG